MGKRGASSSKSAGDGDSGEDAFQYRYGHGVSSLKNDGLNNESVFQVLPIYPETPDEPLYDPKDVKQEVMRARGPGGQVSPIIIDLVSNKH